MHQCLVVEGGQPQPDYLLEYPKATVHIVTHKTQTDMFQLHAVFGFQKEGGGKTLNAFTVNTRQDPVNYAFVTDREHHEKINFLFWQEKCVVCIKRQ